MSRKLQYKVKQRLEMLPGYRETAVYGTGLISRPVGTFPTVSVPLTDRFEYTYSGDKSSFNVCKRYQTINPDAHQRPVAVTRYVDKSLGWKEGVSMWETPTEVGLPDLEVAYVPSGGPLEAPNLGDADEAAHDCYLSLMAATPDRFMNAGRSLCELKDTRQTLRGLRDFLKWAVSAGRGRIKATTTIFEAARMYLTVRFGIEPTVSDVKKFLKQLGSDKLKILQVPRKLEKGTVLRAAYKIGASQAMLNQLCGVPPNGNAVEVRSTWIGTNGVFLVPNTSGSSRPWLPGTWALRRVRCREYRGVLFGRLKAPIEMSSSMRKMRAFEWSCPLGKTFWDLTPFTFLIDWFCDIGSVIERLDKICIGTEIRPQFESGIWHSAMMADTVYQPVISCASTVSLTGEPPDAWYPIWHARAMNSTTVSDWVRCSCESNYARAPYVPPASILLPALRWKLSGYQLSTGAALVISLSKSLKRAFRRT